MKKNIVSVSKKKKNVAMFPDFSHNLVVNHVIVAESD